MPNTTGASLLGRLARWVGAAIMPFALVTNVGAYLLALWLLDETGAAHAVHTEAWRFVTVLLLIGVQALWLVWLRRQALGTLLASVLLWSSAVLVGGHESLAVQPGVLLAAFGYTAERSGRLRGLMVALASLLASFGTLAAHTLHARGGTPDWTTPAVIIASCLVGIATIAGPALAGGWYAQLRDRAEHIAELAHRATSGEAVRTAQAVAAERRTLAQEIHDTSSAHLAALLALGAAAQNSAGTADPTHRRIIRQMSDEGQQLFQGFERMLNSLRQEDRTVTEVHRPGHRPGQHSAADIADLVEEHRRIAGVAVTLLVDPGLEEIDHRLGPMRAHTAYRVVQEALSNARKHAQGADVTVIVEDDGETLLLRIENDETAEPVDLTGMPRDGSLSLGYGLDGMRDRLVAAGGSLRTGPRQRGGWSVNALLPHPPYRRDTGRRAMRQVGPPASLRDRVTAPDSERIATEGVPA